MKNILTNIEHKYPLRNLYKMRWKNDGFRTLFESVVYPEVLEALKDWKMFNPNNEKCVLIGGLALSYYEKPRPTQDLDLIFMSETDFPTEVYKFRKNRQHAFEHIKTHVEVELLTPTHLNVTKEIFKHVFDDAIESDGIQVASPISLIVMKLGRFSNQDQTDIKNLYEYCLENDINTDISKYNLDKESVDRYNKLTESLNESITVYNNHYLMGVNDMLEKNVYEKIESDLPFDIYIFEDNYGEPRFHVGNNILNRYKKINDFQFSISLTDMYKSDKHLKVLESSTDYPSFNMFEKEEELLKEWLSKDNNLEYLKHKWKSINSRNI